MRAKSLALLVLALGCGLVAAIGITQVMAKRSDGPVVPAGVTEEIFVALQEIPFSGALTAQNIKLEAWPKDRIPEGAFRKLSELENRRSKMAILPGEPIVEKKLFKPGDTEQGAVVLIPKGYRVVPVKVDAVTGGANLVLPGNRVDVMVNLRQNPAVGIAETCTRTLLQDIKVFAVNDVVTLERKKGTEETISAKTISLLLTPEQAQKVALATQLGTIQLSLRSPDDEETSAISEMNVKDLFGGEEEGDRVAENPGQQATPAGKDDLLAFLDHMQQKAAPPSPAAAASPAQAETPAPAAPDPSASWQIRVISGEAVNLKLLERQGSADAPGAMWRLSSVDTGIAESPLADLSPVAAPAGAPPDADTNLWADQPQEDSSDQ